MDTDRDRNNTRDDVRDKIRNIDINKHRKKIVSINKLKVTNKKVSLEKYIYQVEGKH